MPRFNSGQNSCAAMIAPTSMPTMPQTMVMMVNWRTTWSLYVAATAAGLTAAIGTATTVAFMRVSASVVDREILDCGATRRYKPYYALGDAPVRGIPDAAQAARAASPRCRIAAAAIASTASLT